MKTHHVYWNDDYDDNGGIGLESFDDQEQALFFITTRMALDGKRTLENYTYIVGKIIQLEAAKRITEIRVKS